MNADTILSEIEFELAQGTISRNELGQSIQAVKRYQNRIRNESAKSRKRAEESRAVGGLFQINEMLITLMQEMVAATRSMQADLRKVARMSHVAAPVVTAANATQKERSRALPDPVDVPTLRDLDLDYFWDLSSEVDDGMRPETLMIGMDVRSSRIPIVGSVVTRLRAAFHNLVLFYVNRLAKRQVDVNQSYGNKLLQLTELCLQQQEQIEVLSARLRIVTKRLSDGSESPTTVEKT